LRLRPAPLPAPGLEIYAIDVERGKSTLCVSSAGPIRAGGYGLRRIRRPGCDPYPGSGPPAGIRQIDFLVISHYHQDHAGGVPPLAARIPIRNFVDHCKNFESVKDNGGVYEAYVKARKAGNHIGGGGRRNDGLGAHPKVAIIHNGATTGGSKQARQAIHDSPGLLNLWQLHYARKSDRMHNVDARMIANEGDRDCHGDWIRVEAQADGSFTVRNGRTGFEKSYR